MGGNLFLSTSIMFSPSCVIGASEGQVIKIPPRAVIPTNYFPLGRAFSITVKCQKIGGKCTLLINQILINFYLQRTMGKGEHRGQRQRNIELQPEKSILL
jgi:hypothetical protein